MPMGMRGNYKARFGPNTLVVVPPFRGLGMPLNSARSEEVTVDNW